MAGNELGAVRAIVFDTFGTVVDWRGSIIDDLSAWGQENALSADWGALVDRWRGLYEPQKNKVRSGEIPWTNLDELHLDALHQLLPDFGLSELEEPQIRHINKVWHRLNAWPDALTGLHRLKSKFIIGPLSNANVALLVNMAKHAGLPWDALFSCELFKHYKPHPATYSGVFKMLYLEPHEVMLCAAHNYDLRAARGEGLQTAFIPRTTEYGVNQKTDLVPDDDWDVVAGSVGELADKMGCADL